MENLTKKRKEKPENECASYDLYYAFCLQRRITITDVQQACDLIVSNSRFLSQKPNWRELADRDNVLGSLEYPIKLCKTTNKTLLDIERMLEELMTRKSSLFDFDMFKNMPEEMMRCILDFYDGGLQIRMVCRKWCKVATDVKRFPLLKYMGLSRESATNLYLVFLLHFASKRELDKLSLRSKDRYLFTIKFNFAETTIKRLKAKPFEGYGEEVVMLSITKDMVPVIHKILKESDEIGEAIPTKRFNFSSGFWEQPIPKIARSMGIYNPGPMLSTDTFKKLMETPNFIPLMRNLYIEHNIPPPNPM
jgi:hypothetical protein